MGFSFGDEDCTTRQLKERVFSFEDARTFWRNIYYFWHRPVSLLIRQEKSNESGEKSNPL